LRWAPALLCAALAAGAQVQPVPAPAFSAAQLPDGPANTLQGQRLYRQLCVGCHGETGMGGTGMSCRRSTAH